jgi:hypothetical protein
MCAPLAACRLLPRGGHAHVGPADVGPATDIIYFVFSISCAYELQYRKVIYPFWIDRLDEPVTMVESNLSFGTISNVALYKPLARLRSEYIA